MQASASARARASGPNHERGLSYLEALTALALLGGVLTSGFALLGHARAHERLVEERLHVLHAIEKEVETVRSMPGVMLTLREAAPFLSATDEIAHLGDVAASITLADGPELGVRRLRVVVEWGSAPRRREVAEELLLVERDRAGGAM